MNYKKKLDQFNATEKYNDEIDFLQKLIDPNLKVLDYGCGTGRAVDMLRERGFLFVDGFDINEHNDSFNYVSSNQKFDQVYFMHSIAHIEHPKSILEQLNTREIIIITPNLKWLNLQENKNYNPDETVLKHFTEYQLFSLMLESGYEVINVGQFGSIEGNQKERLYIKARKK